MSSVPPPAWFLFSSDSNRFAVPLGALAEVVLADRLVRLPLAPPRLAGLCTLRRNVIPVFRPSPRPASVGRRNAAGKALILVIQGSSGSWGYLADHGGAAVSEGEMDDADVMTSARLIRAGVPHSVIDPESAWQELRTEMAAWHPPSPGASRP